MNIKIKASLLGLVAVLLLGAFSAAPAFAEGGPYCHHRNDSKEGEGTKIEEASPENAKGGGGEQKLSGEVAGVRVELLAIQVQIKNVLYNNPDQCQKKTEVHFHELSVVGQPNCTVTVNGPQDTIKWQFHEGWTWNGEKKQLEENPQLAQKDDWIFSDEELQQGAEKLPGGTLAIIRFGGTSCLENGISAEFTGSLNAETRPEGLANWSTKEELIVRKGEASQHFWNGRRFVGVRTGLSLGGRPASYEGTFKLEMAPKQQGTTIQEVASFEK